MLEIGIALEQKCMLEISIALEQKCMLEIGIALEQKCMLEIGIALEQKGIFDAFPFQAIVNCQAYDACLSSFLSHIICFTLCLYECSSNNSKATHNDVVVAIQCIFTYITKACHLPAVARSTIYSLM